MPLRREAEAITHLLTKPPSGGMPISDREAIVKHHMVTGMRFPIAFRSATFRIPYL